MKHQKKFFIEFGKCLGLILGLILILNLIGIAKKTVPVEAQEQIKLKVFVHYPNPHNQPVAILSCTPTANDQVNDFGLTGWHMPSSGMSYKINYNTKPSNLTNTQVLTAVTNSFATWNARS